jgi:hypothetical protein
MVTQRYDVEMVTGEPLSTRQPGHDQKNDRKPAPSLPTYTQLARNTAPNKDVAALSCRFCRQGVGGSRHGEDVRVQVVWLHKHCLIMLIIELRVGTGRTSDHNY